jgi:uncharacterized membrane protein
MICLSFSFAFAYYYYYCCCCYLFLLWLRCIHLYLHSCGVVKINNGAIDDACSICVKILAKQIGLVLYVYSKISRFVAKTLNMTFRHIVVIMIIINYFPRCKFIKNMWVFNSYHPSFPAWVILIWSTYC